MYAQYQSDTTKFLNDLITNNPELEEERLRNRGLLWDITLNPEEQQAFAKSALPRKPYMYQAD